jgi:hypothetical protein
MRVAMGENYNLPIRIEIRLPLDVPLLERAASSPAGGEGEITGDITTCDKR